MRDALAEAGVPVVLNALDNLPGSFDGLEPASTTPHCSTRQASPYCLPVEKPTMRGNCGRS